MTYFGAFLGRFGDELFDYFEVSFFIVGGSELANRDCALLGAHFVRFERLDTEQIWKKHGESD